VGKSAVSKITGAILRAAGLDHHLEICVDGLDAETLRLPGKPDHTLYLEAARRL
jgi:beta-phosphoglucomutase-like phosphatase (HAD superfamily)